MPKTAAAVWKLENGVGLRRLIDVKFKRIELISPLSTHTYTEQRTPNAEHE